MRCEPLLVSARCNGITVYPLGLGCNWPNNLAKFTLLRNALADVGPDELVMATDGFDVLYLRNSTVIEQCFIRSNTRILFSAERLFNHSRIEEQAVFDSLNPKSPVRYLNSGGMIGFAADICALMDSCLAHVENSGEDLNFGSDQRVLCHLFSSQRFPIKLDYSCEVFWCAAGEWDDLFGRFQIVESTLILREMPTSPCVVHVPGRKHRELFFRLYQYLFGADGQLRMLKAPHSTELRLWETSS
jgi:hypothetical protein